MGPIFPAKPIATALLALLALVALVAFPANLGAAPAAPPLTDAAGVPLGISWPVVGAPPKAHHVILSIGDSSLGQALFKLPEVLAQHGFDAVIHDAHQNGSGLLDPIHGVTALELLDQQLVVHPDVDTVIFEWVGVCAFACGPGLPYGSPRFYDTYHAAVGALVAHARARGLDVIWAVAPPAAPAPTADPPAEDWNSLPMRNLVARVLAAQARQYSKAFGIPTVDWWQALSDTSGQWQPRLSYDGAVHDLRLDDKVHLTEDGSLRTSVWTAATLAQVWREPPPPAVSVRRQKAGARLEP